MIKRTWSLFLLLSLLFVVGCSSEDKEGIKLEKSLSDKSVLTSSELDTMKSACADDVTQEGYDLNRYVVLYNPNQLIYTYQFIFYNESEDIGLVQHVEELTDYETVRTKGEYHYLLTLGSKDSYEVSQLMCTFNKDKEFNETTTTDERYVLSNAWEKSKDYDINQVIISTSFDIKLLGTYKVTYPDYEPTLTEADDIQIILDKKTYNINDIVVKKD